MTVRELIELLKAFDQELLVTYDYSIEIYEVELCIAESNESDIDKWINLG